MKRILALAAVVLFAFLAGQRYVVSGDDGTYIALARSLKAGTYRAINVPGEPLQVQYPPLYPLLLLPLSGLPASAVGALRLWTAAWSLLGVIALGLAAKRRDPTLGVLAAIPVVTSPLFGGFGTAVLTEGPFLLITYAVVVRLAAMTDPATESAASPRRLDIFVPLGAAAAFLMKTLGISLIAAVLVHLLVRRRYRRFLESTVLIALVLLPWIAWQNAHTSDYIRGHILQRDIYDPSAGSLDLVHLVSERLPHNLSRYAGRILPEVFFPPFAAQFPNDGLSRGLKALLGGLLSLAVLLGFTRRWKRDAFGAEELYVLITGAVLLFHPVYADRYLFLLLPSLAGYALLAVGNPDLRRRAMTAWGVVLIAGCALALAATTPPEELAYYEAIDWIKEHTPEDAVILARKPAAVWFYSGRHATGYPPSTDTRAWNRGDYVIRDDYTIGIHSARRYIDPVVTDGVLFTPAWTSAILPTVRIYARRPAAT